MTAAVAVCCVAAAVVLGYASHTPAGAAVPVAGETVTGRATFYSLGDSGLGNCSFPPGTLTDRRYVAAGPDEYADSGGCGGHLDVTGPKGTVRVIVADKCPECEPGHLDMSPEAFAEIGDLTAGIIPISYRAVRNPPLPAPLAIKVKEGSSQWWIGFLVLNHGNPLTSVEYRTESGGWQGLARAPYNYWLAERGAGPGPFTLRMTDSYGTRVTVDDVRLEPDTVQDTGVWMYRDDVDPSAATPSPRSPSATASAVGACSARLVTERSWPGGYQATLTVSNDATVAVRPWTVTWTLGDGAAVNAGWNAAVSQNGSTVTARAPLWEADASLAPGASVSIGFNVAGSTSPAGIALNGVLCG